MKISNDDKNKFPQYVSKESIVNINYSNSTIAAFIGFINNCQVLVFSY